MKTLSSIKLAQQPAISTATMRIIIQKLFFMVLFLTVQMVNATYSITAFRNKTAIVISFYFTE
jgi:hypothetical protein